MQNSDSESQISEISRSLRKNIQKSLFILLDPSPQQNKNLKDFDSHYVEIMNNLKQIESIIEKLEASKPFSYDPILYQELESGNAALKNKKQVLEKYTSLLSEWTTQLKDLETKNMEIISHKS
ncbi:hypothetical protein BB560_005125 [Smittium megazygosporum]|uniref:Uncharacterized protein n=1 Tax=Smittium megazygosporum TaxID=133381 RepID=A0A2T9Z7H0_9FUNG|nr:hypothetical protein BB560_005125 [Smittium megazygosporum]